MAQQTHLSLKRINVDKTNARIVVITAVAAFLVMFFLVASWSLFGQLTYQNRVISAKKKAVAQLRTNVGSKDSLVTSYKAFVETPQNLIGGTSAGTGPQDGSNAKLVLDALPSKYDFPALTTSVEKLLTENKGKIQTITGVDDEVAQGASVSEGSPKPVEMPFEVTVEGNYANLQQVINAMQLSIRPIKITSLNISGDQQDLTLRVIAKSYYQPEKTLTIKQETVK